MHFGHFGSVAGFEPPQCRGRRLDDAKNTDKRAVVGASPYKSNFIYKAIDAKAFRIDSDYHT